MKPSYLCYCDDSGGEDDAYRAVAAISGPATVLLPMERSLRKVLSLEGVDELKWVNLRTRPARLRAAQGFLELCAIALGAGVLRVDLLLWQPAAQGLAYQRRSEPERLRPLYYQAWANALAAWPAARWHLLPDQRTGMDWQRWPTPLRRQLSQRGRKLASLTEASSTRSACVQLADLLAGLSRLGCEAPAPKAAAKPPKAKGPAGAMSASAEGDDAEAPGTAARRNRRLLLEHFRDALRRRGVGLPQGPGLLHSRHPLLQARLLKRLPTQA
jgi:hypothetical protein